MDSDGDGDGHPGYSRGSTTAAGQPSTKKRRVTRACDNCRKRRIKCQSYPDATSLDAPCVICTDAGAPELCTYSKPARKRGPQAGKARSLAEKCSTLERLLGYLATTIPNLEAYVSAFASHCATSPPGPQHGGDPSPSSSSTSPSTTTHNAQQAAAGPDVFQQTYESTRIPEILDAILPPPVSAREAAKLKLDEKKPDLGGMTMVAPSSSSSAAGGNHFGAAAAAQRMSYLPNQSPALPPPPAPPIPSFADPSSHAYHYNVSSGGGGDAIMTSLDNAPPHPTTTSSPSIPFALHALANAAVPDHHHHQQQQQHQHQQQQLQQQQHFGAPPAFTNGGATTSASGVFPSHATNVGVDARGKSKEGERMKEQKQEEKAEEDEVFIPDGATRSALLDLYFNQVVQPSFPMLDKSAFLRWSAHLPSNATPLPPFPSLSPSSSLPPSQAPSIPPYLYLSIFALSSLYVPPSSPLRLKGALPPEAPRRYAKRARERLLREVLRGRKEDGEGVGVGGGGGVEMIQSAVLLAMCDWGQGEVERAWFMSSLAVTLAVSQNLHLPTSPSSTRQISSSTATRLKTLHSVLIIHFLLSLRLERLPLSIALLLHDNDDGGAMQTKGIPPPPTDEAENWDLWRSDKTIGELRAEWGVALPDEDDLAGEEETDGDEPLLPDDEQRVPRKRSASGAAIANGHHHHLHHAQPPPPPPAAAVPSNSLVVFARLSELCQIGMQVLRASGGAVDEEEGKRRKQAREELEKRLQKWEEGLEPDLRIGTMSSSSSPLGESGEQQAQAVALVRERPRWTVAMHLVLATLRLRLDSISDPDPTGKTASTLKRITAILEEHRAVFTPFRSLPMSELPLHSASFAVMQDSTAPDATVKRRAARTIVKTAKELGLVLPVVQRICDRLEPLVQTTNRRSHATGSSHKGAPAIAKLSSQEAETGPAALPPPAVQPLPASAPPPVPAPQPSLPPAEPFQAFLSYAQDLGPAAEPSTILDFGSWDQTDLLVSLGLVGAPGPGSGGAQIPLSGGGGGGGGGGTGSGSGPIHDNWAAWGGPIAGAAIVGEAEHDNFPLPVLMETGLGSIFTHSHSHEGAASGGMMIDSVGAGGAGPSSGLVPAQPPPHLSPPTRLPSQASPSVGQMLTQPHQSTSYQPSIAHGMLPSRGSVGGGGGPDGMAISPDPQLYALPRTADPAIAYHHQQQQRPDNAAYLPRSLLGTPVPPGSNMSLSSMEGQQQQQAYEAALGTDLLTRWLDRGTLGFTPETTPGLGGGNGARSGTGGARS
ncbi:hypothetical protein JCM10908_003629 [Rhodotorula pacifica]|uniref:uncharacterized protein n=1 Tax=Rhodotorula pacifica TaxID=1495444 RepID=UPI00317AC6E5